MTLFTKNDNIIEMEDKNKSYGFDIGVEGLNQLMKLRGKELIDRLNKDYGGLNGLVQKLKADSKNGLQLDNETALKQRQNAYGKNEIPAKPMKTFLKLCWEALHDLMLIILLVCSFVSIGLSFYKPPTENTETKEANIEWVEGVAILMAVLVVVLVTAFNDWRKEKQFRGLQAKIENDQLSNVIRNGKIQQINVQELVVGDMCLIKYGDLLPADGILVQASDVKVDESSLTGETDLIKKNESENIGLLSGTYVMEGTGMMIITAVGLNSQVGRIMTLLGTTENKEKKKGKSKNRASHRMSSSKKNENEDRSTNEQIFDISGKLESNKQPSGNKDDEKPLRKEEKNDEKRQKSVLQTKLTRLALYIGYIAITVVVVAVPEGLPLAVTLALAYAVRKMMDDHNLVRHLDACETMGNATTICSDKTGTLTTNRMTCVQLYIGEKYYEKIPNVEEINSDIISISHEAMAVNTNYTSKIEESNKNGGLAKQIGNKTECALLDLVKMLNGSYDDIRQRIPELKFVKVYTFNSARKMMSTIITRENGDYRMYTKGASEIVLSKCKYILDSNGQPVDLTRDELNKITHDIIEKMANNSLRTICIAYKDFYNEQNWDEEEEIVSNLICICIVGIEDPVRSEVPKAIEKCQRAGIIVRMVTGDNLTTARSIATKCGIIKPTDKFLVVESKEFNKQIRDAQGNVSQKLLDEIWPNLRVLARSSPEDKYILVNGIVNSKISSHREVVAVTGDGTNDGPALKRADVGFAMGIQGTDVAKQASDIILTDDNFSSIVKAIMWGRNVYDSVAKFLQFQLTANLSAGLISVISAAAISTVPLRAVQMLWVNLIMDTLASLALATEPPTEELLDRKPYGRTKSIISAIMLKNIIGHALYQLIIMLIILYLGDQFLEVESTVKGLVNHPELSRLPSQQFTIVFNAFVLMTLFNEINCRKLHGERNVFKGISKNPFFYCIWIFSFGVQIIIVTFGNVVFNCVSLSIQQWGWCILFGIGSLIWAQYFYVNCKIEGEENPAEEDDDYTRYFTTGNLIGAETMILPPLPGFTQVLWHKSVQRLQMEFRVINAFRVSRIEEVTDRGLSLKRDNQKLRIL
ncbi:unnamed protein product [Didymodactylos carnosus]|uniref:Calcium-transporting ATPase n=1 Tax=Didymodactylos carnosus TaxID=1234261 RepID=A0A813R0K3_9BILA|nr:unnamed protein product [Didymodactylos carnosus]CAF0852813.1 unnamed protein product [Didymodactylos carnosus]CAF3556720.1 unnamed protein product [Didymodactylos carnosus]CAF3637970.1 unnamed protein product [Didymodactylos carnosus]